MFLNHKTLNIVDEKIKKFYFFMTKKGLTSKSALQKRLPFTTKQRLIMLGKTTVYPHIFTLIYIICIYIPKDYFFIGQPDCTSLGIMLLF